MGKKTLLAGAVVLVLAVGFGAADLYIWKGVHFNAVDYDTPCPTIDVASLPGQKLIFQQPT